MGMSANRLAVVSGADSDLYCLNSSGIQKVDAAGGVTQLIASDDCSLSGPGANVRDVFLLPDGSFVVSLNEGFSVRLLKYSWDERAELDKNKTINIWSLEDNDSVRAAINVFRTKHPDAVINYEIALGADGAASTEDAIRNLNTRLLNGDGPDIMILDDCPVETYINEGILLDLTGKLEVGGIYPQILKIIDSAGLYVVAAQFSIPTLIGLSEDLMLCDSLEKIVEEAVNGQTSVPLSADGNNDPFSSLTREDRPVFYFDSSNDVFNILWPTCAPEVISSEGLNLQALTTFVSAFKDLSDKYGLGTAESMEIVRGAMSASSSGRGRAIRIGGGIISFMGERALLGTETLMSVSFLNMFFGRGSMDGAKIVSFPGLVPATWIPSSIAGINADSGVTDLALDFVSAMLSDTVQGADYATGFPVTRRGVEIQIDEINARISEFGDEIFEFDFDGLLEQLKTPSLMDRQVTDTVREAAGKCCLGEKSVEEAVSEIEQVLKKYLAERVQ